MLLPPNQHPGREWKEASLGSVHRMVACQCRDWSHSSFSSVSTHTANMATCTCVTGRLSSANTSINIVPRSSRQCSRTLISWLIVLHVSFSKRKKQNGCQVIPSPATHTHTPAVATTSSLCTGAAVHLMTSLDFTCSGRRRSPCCKVNVTEVRFNGWKADEDVHWREFVISKTLQSGCERSLERRRTQAFLMFTDSTLWSASTNEHENAAKTDLSRVLPFAIQCIFKR